jgi:hypothetical protein
MEFITEKEAQELTGLKRTRLYKIRKDYLIRWKASPSGRKIQYHKGDLLKLKSLPFSEDSNCSTYQDAPIRTSYISFKEACHVFSITRWTLKREIKKSGIKEIKSGRETLVKLNDLRKIFSPEYYVGKHAVEQLAVSNTYRVTITIKCRGFHLKRTFIEPNIKEQIEWIEAQQRIFLENQKRFLDGRARDWGKLKYYTVNDLHHYKKMTYHEAPYYAAIHQSYLF